MNNFPDRRLRSKRSHPNGCTLGIANPANLKYFKIKQYRILKAIALCKAIVDPLGLFCIHRVSNILHYNYALTYYTKHMPTREQLLMAVQVCHLLSEMMQPIEVFLYTKRNAQFFLIAGRKANIRITLYPDLTMEMEIDV